MERIRKRSSNERGQASVEYVLIFCALLAIALGLAALWRYGQAAGFVSLAQDAASHQNSAGLGGIQDATLF